MALFNSYASDLTIESWASSNGQNPDVVATYVAANSRMPRSTLELQNWVNQTSGLSAWPAGIPQQDEDAYIQAHLGLPNGPSDVKSWLQSQGLMDTSGNFTSNYVPALYFYDKSTGQQAPAPPGTSGATAPAAPAASPFAAIIDSAQAHPILWAGGVGVGIVGFLLVTGKIR